MYQNASSCMILFRSNMDCLFFMVLLHCHFWHGGITVLCLPLFTYYLANRRLVSYLLNSIFKLKEQTICNVHSIIPEAWNIKACKPVWIFLFIIKRTLWHIRTPKWPISHCAANIWICPLSHQSRQGFKRIQFKWNFLCTLWIRD